MGNWLVTVRLGVAMVALTGVVVATGAGPARSAMATAPAASAPVTAAAGANCADVLFVGARGSGETGPGNPGWKPASSDPYGLGSTVESARRRLMADLGGHRTAQVLSVSYTASGVQTLAFSAKKYFGGLASGVTWTMRKLGIWAGKCPAQQIVLAGYSQGAMVMHRVLHDLASASTKGQLLPAATRKAILARVSAAVLVGDGDEVPDDYQTRFGTASAGARGIGQALRTISHSSAAKFSKSFRQLVLSVCNKHDLVCGWTDFNLTCLTNPVDCVLPFKTMIRIHLSYPGSKPLLAAADQAARDVRAVPVPTPRTITLNAVAGVSFRHQLTADAGPGYSLEWGVVPRKAMPAGLALSSSGLISGRPAGAGLSTTPVRVRSVRKGAHSIWAVATVKLNVRASLGTWTVSKAPVPDNAMAGDSGVVASVACPSPAWCVTVGDYTDSSGVGQAMVTSGPPAQPGAWAVTEAPRPGNASVTDNAGLDDVACGSPAYCVAIGGYLPGSGNGSDGLLLIWSQSAWTPIQAPLPANAFRFPDGAVHVSLSSVACAPSSTTCVIAGSYYDDANGDLAPLLLTGYGTSWTALEGPQPAGATPSSNTGLSSVTCASATSCVAVGAYGSTNEPLLLTGYGTSWQADNVKPPANDDTNYGSYLSSVACASSSSCAAIGEYTAQQGNGLIITGFLMTGAGTAWNAAESPLPGNAGSLSGSPPPLLSGLASVACSPNSGCVAAGGYATNTISAGGGIIYQGLLESRQGSAWVPAEAPAPPGSNASYGSSLSAVTCMPTTTCVGAGGYSDQSGTHLLLVTGSGSTWTPHTVTLPADADPNAGATLSLVTCASDSACVAIGAYFNSQGNQQEIVVTGPGQS